MTYLGDEITKNIEFSLSNRYFRNDAFNFQIFKKLLKECNAVVAGGSIIGSTNKKGFIFDSNDIDIYVRCEDSKPILRAIFGEGNYKKYRKAKFSRYCDTFLTRNGIRCIYHCKYTDKTYYKSIDVMTVRNSTTPLNAIKGFDLTFCQVWYDGDKVYANYPEDVLSKVGYLRGDYIIPFLNSNKFLIERYKKYTKRGFTIKIDYPDEHTVEKDMMGIVKAKKFKELTIEELLSIYNTEDKKKKMITKMILESLTKDIDDCGYDTDDYEDIESFYTFGKDKVDLTVSSLRNQLLASTSPHNKNNILLGWMNLLKDFS